MCEADGELGAEARRDKPRLTPSNLCASSSCSSSSPVSSRSGARALSSSNLRNSSSILRFSAGDVAGAAWMSFSISRR